MTQVKPEFPKDTVFKNVEVMETYIIIDVWYDKNKSQKMYKLQQSRMKFQMIKMSESAIKDNIERGVWKVE